MLVQSTYVIYEIVLISEKLLWCTSEILSDGTEGILYGLWFSISKIEMILWDNIKINTHNTKSMHPS